MPTEIVGYMILSEAYELGVDEFNNSIVDKYIFAGNQRVTKLTEDFLNAAYEDLKAKNPHAVMTVKGNLGKITVADLKEGEKYNKYELTLKKLEKDTEHTVTVVHSTEEKSVTSVLNERDARNSRKGSDSVIRYNPKQDNTAEIAVSRAEREDNQKGDTLTHEGWID